MTRRFCALNVASACLAAGLAGGVHAHAMAADPNAPVVVSGTVADEAAKAGLLARLRAVFGARVIDQLSVGTVATPADWDSYVQRLITPRLKDISGGQLAIDGNTVSLRGEVPSEAARQQIAADMAASLNPTYTVNNTLRVAASEQKVLDDALADRIIEFESGQATLADSGKRILDQMGAVMLRMKDKKVEVIGHTDNAGSRASNLPLSQARAQAVKLYLASKGVNPDLIAVSGEGPDRPAADNRTAQGRAHNRRIEFKVVL